MYASMLMIGVTLALGGLVTSAALNQLSAAAEAGSVGTSVGQSSSGAALALVYATVGSQGSCPSYRGQSEGSTLVLAIYNYGPSGFATAQVIVNSTFAAGTFPAITSETLTTVSVPLAGCAHPSGQTVLLVDSLGGEAQLGS